MLNSYSRKSLMLKTIVGGANARTGYTQRRPQVTGSGCGLASHFGVSQAHHAPQARGRLAHARGQNGMGSSNGSALVAGASSGRAVRACTIEPR